MVTSGRSGALTVRLQYNNSGEPPARMRGYLPVKAGNPAPRKEPGGTG
jgi:hypothetical protein